MFGATTQPQGGGGTGLFGNQQQNNSTPAFSFGQPQQQPQSTFSFGGTSSQPQTGLFGNQQPQQQQQQQQSTSLFGNNNNQQQQQQPQQQPQTQINNTQPSFSWSKPNDSKPFGASTSLFGQPQPQQQQQPQPVLLAQQEPQQPQQQGVPSVIDQLNRIRSSWDPTSPSCAFQYYFYNRVPQQQVALYVKPANQDQVKWDSAVASRPDSSSVPVLAVGFTDLRKRVDYQIFQINAYRTRMHEINDKLTELQSRHDLYTTVKIIETKTRHETIKQRSIRLAAKVQLLRCRGFSLRPEEETLKLKLEQLQQEIKDPAVFGRISEVWAKLAILRERLKNTSLWGGGEEQQQQQESIDWERDQDQLDKIVKILQEQQQGLAYLINIVKQDDALVNEKLEQQIAEKNNKEQQEQQRSTRRR